MLTNAPAQAQIPVTDLARAKTFYTEKLGLKVESDTMEGLALLAAGEGTKLMLYVRPPVHTDHTLAAFVVDDIYAEIAELTQKGVMFEQYDMGGGYKTDDKGVMSIGPVAKAAWFKDSEGNTLSLQQKV